MVIRSILSTLISILLKCDDHDDAGADDDDGGVAHNDAVIT